MYSPALAQCEVQFRYPCQHRRPGQDTCEVVAVDQSENAGQSEPVFPPSGPPVKPDCLRENPRANWNSAQLSANLGEEVVARSVAGRSPNGKYQVRS